MLTGAQPPLKICIFTETFYPVVGGGETQARLLAQELVRCGHQVIVLTRRVDRAQKSREKLGEVQIYRLPPAGKAHWHKWGLLFSGLFALIRRKNEYDTLLVSGFRVIGLPAVLAARLLGKKCILKADNNGELSGAFFQGGLSKVKLSGSSLLFKIFLAIRRSFFWKADAFVALSAQIEQEIREGLPGYSRPVVRIPNALDPNSFHPVTPDEKIALRRRLVLPEQRPMVTYTGRLVSYKGLPVLLKAWQGLLCDHPDALLVLVGGGSLDIYNCEQELRQFTAENDLGRSVFFAGEVSNVAEYLQASDIFVFPTEKEAFGIALIEAMACGLPVISTATGGIKDFLQDRHNGLLIPAGDATAIRSALDELMQDRRLAERLGNKAHHSAQQFSISTVTQRYLQLFYEVHGDDSYR